MALAAVNRSNELDPARDPAANTPPLCVPFFLADVDVGKQSNAFFSSIYLTVAVINEAALEITTCQGGPVSDYITEVKG